jgi:ribosomal silencing factor RsfS
VWRGALWCGGELLTVWEGSVDTAVAIRLAIEADNVKAEDIVVLHVEHHCSWASYFVIATARSRPQLEAVVGRMRDAAKEDFDRDFQKNNESSSQAWAVMDLGRYPSPSPVTRQ